MDPPNPHPPFRGTRTSHLILRSPIRASREESEGGGTEVELSVADGSREDGERGGNFPARRSPFEKGGGRIRSALTGVAGAARAVKKQLVARAYQVLDGDGDGDGAYAFPARPSPADYALHPIRGFRCFFQGLVGNFGSDFACIIGVNYFCVKGMLLSIMGLVRLSYCKKSLGVDGTACQTMGAIASTPFAFKGAIGVLSDMYPLWGYHKASYIIASAVVGSLAFLGLASLPISTPTAAAALFFVANLEVATADLLCEGRYTTKMQEKPATGSMMVSYVWGLWCMGTLVAALLVGPLADSTNPKYVFWLCVPLAASIILPVAKGFLGDAKVSAEKRGKMDWALARQHPLIMAYCLTMAAAALGNAVLDTLLFDWHRLQFGYAIVASVALSVLAFRWLPKQMARCNFYMFLHTVLYVNLSGSQDFWFTADEQCVPGGPAFDYTYYNSYTHIVGAVTGWFGIVLFQATMSHWPFRRLFWVTTLLQVVASAFDLLIIARLNIAVGISDKVFYMFGDAVIGPAVGIFAAMPGLVLTSKLVPKGLESTVYALLAGFQHFGQVVSSQVGLYAVGVAGIRTTGDCDFQNLGWLVLVCHCLLPLIAVPLTFVLIPDMRMTDSFEHASLGSELLRSSSSDMLMPDTFRDPERLVDATAAETGAEGDERDGTMLHSKAGASANSTPTVAS